MFKPYKPSPVHGPMNWYLLTSVSFALFNAVEAGDMDFNR